jgi:multidrug efflux pump subunit AcrB
MTFAVIIIIAVYLPILFLQGLEGRMFRPMAITVCTALAGSLILALTFVPAMTTVSFARGVKSSGEPLWVNSISNAYTRALQGAIRYRYLTIGTAIVILAIALASLAYIGTEFMPESHASPRITPEVDYQSLRGQLPYCAINIVCHVNSNHAREHRDLYVSHFAWQPRPTHGLKLY